jgi:hypothetical protein
MKVFRDNCVQFPVDYMKENKSIKFSLNYILFAQIIKSEQIQDRDVGVSARYIIRTIGRISVKFSIGN